MQKILWAPNLEDFKIYYLNLFLTFIFTLQNLVNLTHYN
jgi:hypothetical protein